MRLPQLPTLGIAKKTGLALKRSRTFFEHDIWQPEAFGRKDPTAIFYAVLRLLAIILRGITQNKILNQAASMGYYSLIAFEPMLAMIVMISSFVFQGSEEDLAGKALNKMVIFIAPLQQNTHASKCRKLKKPSQKGAPLKRARMLSNSSTHNLSALSTTSSPRPALARWVLSARSFLSESAFNYSLQSNAFSIIFGEPSKAAHGANASSFTGRS